MGHFKNTLIARELLSQDANASMKKGETDKNADLVVDYKIQNS